MTFERMIDKWQAKNVGANADAAPIAEVAITQSGWKAHTPKR